MLSSDKPASHSRHVIESAASSPPPVAVAEPAAQWAWHVRCGLLMLHESVGELLRALLDWRLDRAFLAADAARAEAVRAMVAASVERATIEYGAASDDATELLGVWERVQAGRGTW